MNMPEVHKTITRVATSLNLSTVPVFAVYLHSKTLNPLGVRQIREVKNENVHNPSGTPGVR